MSDDFELMIDLIGSEKAYKITEAFAGSVIYIPKSIVTNKNHRDIRKKHGAGSTYRELSAEYGYSEAYIRNIIPSRKLKA
jgi:Mor family transcriptional regulator